MRSLLHPSLGALALVLVAAAAPVACGSSSNGAAPTGPADAGGDVAADVDAADAADAADASDSGSKPEAEAAAPYPAFTLDVPQIVKNQATVLASPVLVTVTWPGDSNASTWEAFDDGLGATAYWAATTAEYGVGKATSTAADHVRMTEPLPASISYTDLQNLVTAAVAAALSPDAGAPEAGAPEAGAGDAGAPNPVWPAPTLDAHHDPQTIYSLFIPAATAVTDPGTNTPFCNEGATGYHGSVTAGSITVAYSVTLECPMFGVDGAEETAAHETVESATDPYAYTGNDGYHGFDPDHLAWDLYTGFNDELADACQSWQYAYTQLTGTWPYWVQLSWSNDSVSKGHDPCVPAPAGPYHGMTTFRAEQTAAMVDLTAVGGTAMATRGYAVTVGKSTTFHVGFYSDAPSAPWTISHDFPSMLQINFSPLGNGAATVSISQTKGANGDMATVTVTPTSKGQSGFHVMAITWDPPTAMGYAPKYLPIVLIDR